MDESKKMPKGVRLRGNSLDIAVSINGKRKYFTLPHPPTAQGIQTAGKIRAYLKQKADWGVLTQNDINEACQIEGQHFDEDLPTFAEYAQIYLDSLPSDNSGTRDKYKGILNNHWMPYFSAEPIASITPSMIRAAIRKIDFNKPKTHNGALTPLRGVFDLAFLDEVINDLPTKRIRNKKIQKEEADPFLPHEREQILEWMKTNWQGEKEVWYLYYLFQFWTGCRPGETLALNWSDIGTDTFKVSRTISNGKVSDVTKTHHIRNVNINKKARIAIERMRQLTGHQDRVFISLHTEQPWTRPDKLSSKLEGVLNAIKIRKRPAYNCRHTYATKMLNDLINENVAAYQLGHDVQTFKTIYAKWLNSKKMKDEMNKLDTDS